MDYTLFASIFVVVFAIALPISDKAITILKGRSNEQAE